MRTIVAISLPLAILAACAGRSPQPVAVVQPQDRYADCAAIIAEVQADNAKIRDLAGDEGSKVTQNVAAGVVGLVIWPVWFGMDFQGAAGKEIAALQSREQYLAVLAEQRNCGAPMAAPFSTAPPTTPPVPAAAGSISTAIPAPAPASLSTPVGTPSPNSAPSATAAPLSTAPETNSYEQAQQQFRHAEQEYERQLDVQRAQYGH